MIIEGRNAVNEALKGNVTIEKALISKSHTGSLNKIISELKTQKIKFSYVDKDVIDKHSKTKSHQGVIAFATDFKYSDIDDIIYNSNNDKKLIIILDGIVDPHNLGSIIRIADSVNANGIILPRHRSCTVTNTVIKVSAGAVWHVKIAKVTNINDTIRDLKNKGIFVLVADMQGESIYNNNNLVDDLAIVIGGEGKGVHLLTKKLADGTVSLPQLGQINSLNAAVASGVILYECIRKRNEQSK